MHCELEAERGHIWAESFRNQATRGQDQGDPPDPPPPVHQIAPSQPNPANPLIMNEYNLFNLANVTTPIAPKWKKNEFILDEYHKFQYSFRIFNGPMAHITSGEVKTSMFLIWAGADGQYMT